MNFCFSCYIPALVQHIQGQTQEHSHLKGLFYVMFANLQSLQVQQQHCAADVASAPCYVSASVLCVWASVCFSLLL